MKKKIAIVVLVIGILYLTLSPFVISLFKSEDARILETINTGNTDSISDASELVFKQKVEDGVFCLAVSKNDLFIVSYLKNEKFSDTQYNLLGRFTADIDKVISDDPTSVKEMHIANFSKHSYYFGFCTSEKAKRLNVDGAIVEPKKISVEIGDKVYFGYFWYCKSTTMPAVQICEDGS